jgi:hypothetical protein
MVVALASIFAVRSREVPPLLMFKFKSGPAIGAALIIGAVFKQAEFAKVAVPVTFPCTS